MMHSERMIATSDRLPDIVFNALNEAPVLGQVLDVGAGDGRMARAFQYDIDVDVFGVEYDEALVRESFDPEARERVILADALRLPFASASFDTVTSINTLHEVVHGDDQQERDNKLTTAIGEYARVLRPGGNLIIYDGIMPQNADQRLLMQSDNPEAIELLQRFEREYMAHPVGFEPVDGLEGAFETDLASLVCYLTKINYLKAGDAWEGERRQFYPFTTIEGMAAQIERHGMTISGFVMPTKGRKGLGNVLSEFDVYDLETQIKYEASTFPSTQMVVTATKQ